MLDILPVIYSVQVRHGVHLSHDYSKVQYLPRSGGFSLLDSVNNKVMVIKKSILIDFVFKLKSIKQ